MRVTQAKLAELAELRDFFREWYGRGWEGVLVNAGMVGRGQIVNTLTQRGSFSAVMLPRLRYARQLLENVDPSKPLAKPPPIQVRNRRETLRVDRILEPMHEDDAQHSLC